MFTEACNKVRGRLAQTVSELGRLVGTQRKSRWSRDFSGPIYVTMWIGGGGGERSNVRIRGASSRLARWPSIPRVTMWMCGGAGERSNVRIRGARHEREDTKRVLYQE